MFIAALVLIVVGALIAAAAVLAWSFDFAVAVLPGWHVTVFPPPVFVGVMLMIAGGVGLLASNRRR
jgi:hypothetical protein